MHRSKLMSIDLRVALGALLLPALLGCDTNYAIDVSLAPEVVSSQDGTIHASAQVFENLGAGESRNVEFSVSYVDRNGEEHVVDALRARSDDFGVAEVILEGFAWEGAGTITASLLSGDSVVLEGGEPVAATATFSVLDLTPPSVTILPPTADLKVGPGFPLQVQVQVSDEIGVSEVFLEAAGDLNRLRSTVVASGSKDTTVTFELEIPDGARPGPTITLYALAADLSGNQAAAEPIVLEVDDTIAFGVTEGLQGDILAQGSNELLVDPIALALSPKDGKLYVTDNAQSSGCDPSCVRVIDPTTGAVDATIEVGSDIRGLAFDAAGDLLFVTDADAGLLRLSGALFATTEACNDNDLPDAPYHLVIDPTLGPLVADEGDSELMRQETCPAGGDPTALTDANFDRPYGVAFGATGNFYLSDEGDGVVYDVASNGDSTTFESSIESPRGLAWLAGGTTSYADSLLVADGDRNVISSTVGPNTARTAIYLRNEPVDVEYSSGTLFVLTSQSAGNPGRIFAFSGF